MSTTFYPTNTASTATSTTWTHSPTVDLWQLGAAGSGVVSQTDNTIASLSANFTALSTVGIIGVASGQVLSSGTGPDLTAGSIVFVTNPLNAVTISGAITANLRGLESSTMANYVIGCVIYQLLAGGGAINGQVANGVDTVEIGTTESARSLSLTVSSATLAAGDRLVLEMGWAGIGTSAAGFTAQAFWNGTTGGASGDTFVTFTETITEYVPPAGYILPRMAVWNNRRVIL